MTPRTDMVCLDLADDLDTNLHIIFEEQLTRYPLCKEDKDHIVGFLHVKDLLKALYTTPGRRVSLRRLARKALVVPDSMDVSVLLKTMQQQRAQMAVQQEKARQLIDGMSRFPQTENAVQASENLGGVLDSANHNYQVLLQAVNGQARISSQTVRNLLG